MADRTVEYSFRGNFANLTAGLTAAGVKVKALGTELNGLDAKGAKSRRALGDLGATAGKFGLVAAAGLGAIVGVTAKFDQAMSVVQADTHETAANMELLRQAAIKAGADTAFSASEAADGIDQLAKAGVSTADILGGGLSGALNLAAAGGVSVGDAAETAASAMTQFGLAGSEMNHVADLLAAGAGKAQGSVQDLSYALKYAGVPAHALGVSIEETTGVLAEFASTGIVGEQAGTTLRSMLLSLAAPTSKASVLMSEYGINLYDAQGKFVGLTDVANQLHSQLGGLSEAQRNAALSTIFGQNAIQGAITLYEGGGQAVADWTDKVWDNNYAVDSAHDKLNNLAGDFEQLKGSLETALIGAGDSSQGPLRKIVQGVTDTVNAYSRLPGPAKAATTGALAVTAAVGGGMFAYSKATAGLATLRTSLVGLGLSEEKAALSTKVMGRALGAASGVAVFALGVQNASRTVGTFETTLGAAAAGLAIGGPWGGAVGAAIGLVVGLGASHDDTAKKVAELTATFDEQTGAITDNTRAKVAQELQTDGLLDAADALGLKQGTVTAAVLGSADAITYLNTTLSQYGRDYSGTSVERLHRNFTDAQVSAILADRAATKLRDALPGLSTNFASASTQAQQLAAETSGAATANYGLNHATSDAAMAARAQAQAITGAVKAMQDQTKAALDAFDAETQYRQALAAATEQAKKNNAGIRGSSKDALANRDALSGLAAAWNGQSAAVQNNTARYKQARQDFLDTAAAMKIPQAAAKQLADQLLDVPKSVTTKALADTADAYNKVLGYKALLTALDGKTAKTYIDTVHRDVRPGVSAASLAQNVGSAYGDILHFAQGGDFPNRHQPELYRGRVTRIWGEPETQGEAYIPLANDARRPRARGILEQTADMLGGQVRWNALGYVDSQGRRHPDDSGDGSTNDQATGSAGRLSDALHRVKRELEGLNKELDRSKDKLSKEQQQLQSMRSYSAQVGSSLSGDLFGNGLAGFNLAASANRNDNRAALAALKRAKANGLSGPLFNALAASGDLNAIEQFAQLGRGQIRNEERLYASSLSSGRALGGSRRRRSSESPSPSRAV